MNDTNHRADVLLVIATLGICGLLGEAGLIYLLVNHVDAAGVAILSPIVGGAIGGLCSLLASTGPRPAAGTSADPVQTQVVNTATDPVETHQVGAGTNENPGTVQESSSEASTVTVQPSEPSYPPDTGQVAARTGQATTPGIQGQGD